VTLVPSLLARKLSHSWAELSILTLNMVKASRMLLLQDGIIWF
jgi:hypothetical protein